MVQVCCSVMFRGLLFSLYMDPCGQREIDVIVLIASGTGLILLWHREKSWQFWLGWIYVVLGGIRLALT